MRDQKKRGFTLIELLVVMAIIAVLSTIIAGNFIRSQMRARDSKRKSDLGQVQRALEQYMNDHGTYPQSDAGGKIVGCGANGTTACVWGEVFQSGSGCATGLQPCSTYMIKLPSDGKAPTIQYTYKASATATKYQIFIHLENVQDSDNVSPAYTPLCGTSTCTYGVSSTNTTPGSTL